jgi:hypothetical protein
MMRRSRYYPTHDYQEIRVFRRVWANLGQLCSMSLATPVRENESKYTKHAYYASSNEAIHLPLISCPICATTATDDREAGSWGPFGNNVSLLFYQPIDEIRDYFVYTKALMWPSLIGILCLLFAIIMGEGIDPNKNDLTILYSLYIAMWSVQFLHSWARRECELRFLWGTELVAEKQVPRPQFVSLPLPTSALLLFPS